MLKVCTAVLNGTFERDHLPAGRAGRAQSRLAA